MKTLLSLLTITAGIALPQAHGQTPTAPFSVEEIGPHHRVLVSQRGPGSPPRRITVLGTDKKNYPNYVAVVKQVKTTAQDVIKGSVADPFSPNFTFSWRTSGHGGPGGSFKLLGSAAGNNFYGLAAPKPPKK